MRRSLIVFVFLLTACSGSSSPAATSEPAEPAVARTAEPTAPPAVEPTVVPSVVPTAEPTSVPTVEPTAAPALQLANPSQGMTDRDALMTAFVDAWNAADWAAMGQLGTEDVVAAATQWHNPDAPEIEGVAGNFNCLGTHPGCGEDQSPESWACEPDAVICQGSIYRPRVDRFAFIHPFLIEQVQGRWLVTSLTWSGDTG